MAEAGHAVHPVVSTVTYLSGGSEGAPTVILDRTLEQSPRVVAGGARGAQGGNDDSTITMGDGSVRSCIGEDAGHAGHGDGTVAYETHLSTEPIHAAFVSWPRILKHTSFGG